MTETDKKQLLLDLRYLRTYGAHLVGKQLLRTPQGGRTCREGQDDYKRRLQRYAKRLRERMRRREQLDEAIRAARRGQRHNQAGAQLKQQRRLNAIRHRRSVHRMLQADNTVWHKARGLRREIPA